MNNQYRWSLSRPDNSLRASDADRDRVADRLRASHTEGRLDLTEFQERLEDCYQAKTLGELRELVRDLPRQDEQQERGRPAGFLAWRPRPSLLVPVLIVLIVAAAATGGHGGHGGDVFWLWIPLVFLFWRLSWWRRRAGRQSRPGGWL